MHSSVPPGAVSVLFDDHNLVADAGLVPVMRLAERGRLPELVRETVRIDGAGNSGGANPVAKVTSLLAVMCAGADSIEGTDRLRHGAMPQLFDGIRAPSTLGTFLRSFTHGIALQLHVVHRRFLRELAARIPLLPGAGQVAFIDVDSTHKRVFGPAKQGAQAGRFKGIRTLHPLLATICTPTARPVIAAVRLWQGTSADSRGVRTVRHRSPGHRRRGRLHRHPHPARGQPVLQRRRGGRLPPGRCSLLDHDGDEPLHQARKRCYTRGRLDTGPLPEGGHRS